MSDSIGILTQSAGVHVEVRPTGAVTAVGGHPVHRQVVEAAAHGSMKRYPHEWRGMDLQLLMEDCLNTDDWYFYTPRLTYSTNYGAAVTVQQHNGWLYIVGGQFGSNFHRTQEFSSYTSVSAYNLCQAFQENFGNTDRGLTIPPLNIPLNMQHPASTVVSSCKSADGKMFVFDDSGHVAWIDLNQFNTCPWASTLVDWQALPDLPLTTIPMTIGGNIFAFVDGTTLYALSNHQDVGNMYTIDLTSPIAWTTVTMPVPGAATKGSFARLGAGALLFVEVDSLAAATYSIAGNTFDTNGVVALPNPKDISYDSYGVPTETSYTRCVNVFSSDTKVYLYGSLTKSTAPEANWGVDRSYVYSIPIADIGTGVWTLANGFLYAMGSVFSQLMESSRPGCYFVYGGFSGLNPDNTGNSRDVNGDMGNLLDSNVGGLELLDPSRIINTEGYDKLTIQFMWKNLQSFHGWLFTSDESFGWCNDYAFSVYAVMDDGALLPITFANRNSYGYAEVEGMGGLDPDTYGCMWHDKANNDFYTYDVPFEIPLRGAKQITIKLNNYNADGSSTAGVDQKVPTLVAAYSLA